MKKWLSRSLTGLAGVVGLAAAVAAAGVLLADRKLNRVLAQPAYALLVPSDAASVERGRYLFNSRGCIDCHGDGGAGRVFINDVAGGMKLAGPNISPGPGNVVAGYKPEDWERAVRHGIKPDGRPLLIMPSEDYNRLTDADLGALVAFVRQLPPSAGGAAIVQLPIPVRVLYGLGQIQDAAEKIDHSLAPQLPVPEAVSVEHGRYVAYSCIGCHGAHLSGGKIPGTPPDWPAAANLTPGAGSAMPLYADAAQFKAMLRTGKRPDGSRVSPVMPFEALGHMSDIDVDALYAFIKTLPARPAGGR